MPTQPNSAAASTIATVVQVLPLLVSPLRNPRSLTQEPLMTNTSSLLFDLEYSSNLPHITLADGQLLLFLA